MPLSAVAPVVVKPDIVSKKATDGRVTIPLRRKGSIPIMEKSSHVVDTIKKASRRPIPWFFEPPKKWKSKPSETQINVGMPKSTSVLS